MNLLQQIARDGHVYGFSLDYGAVVSSQGSPRPRLIGIKQASTFTGFCAKHDDQLFADIEKKRIISTKRHACLLAYRALCRELFAKEGGTMLDPPSRTIDPRLAVPEQIALQRLSDDFMTGLTAGLTEIRERKQQYDKILTCGDYSAVKYCTIWFEQPPDLMCSGCTSPEWDFAGNYIQDLADLDTRAQSIALSLVASEQRGCAFFSWLSQDERACTKLMRSLLDLSREQIPGALVRFVLSSFENQFWRPAWWEALDEQTQNALMRRFAVTVDPCTPEPPNSLCDDGLRVVDWRITGAETNQDALVDGAARLTSGG